MRTSCFFVFCLLTAVFLLADARHLPRKNRVIHQKNGKGEFDPAELEKMIKQIGDGKEPSAEERQEMATKLLAAVAKEQQQQPQGSGSADSNQPSGKQNEEEDSAQPQNYPRRLSPYKQFNREIYGKNRNGNDFFAPVMQVNRDPFWQLRGWQPDFKVDKIMDKMEKEAKEREAAKQKQKESGGNGGGGGGGGGSGIDGSAIMGMAIKFLPLLLG